jgi:hypothetical protein
MITVLRANGATIETICGVVGITDKTLTKHCRKELDGALDNLRARMGATLVRTALNGNVNAMKFWLATHGGPEWRVPKDPNSDAAATAALLGDDEADPVTFYMPSNGRDEPETDDGPIIDGDAEAA